MTDSFTNIYVQLYNPTLRNPSKSFWSIDNYNPMNKIEHVFLGLSSCNICVF